jgi:Family of unknown function (DUF6812)
MDNRTERITVETDRYRISGDLTLPKEGYRSRVSDYLNIGDLAFLPLVDVEVIPLGGGEPERRQFMAVGRAHIHVVYPTPEDGVGPG